MDRDQTLAYFQEVSGVESIERCQQILEQFSWNLEDALNSQLGLEDRPFANSPRTARQGGSAVRTVSDNRRSFIGSIFGLFEHFVAFRPRSTTGWVFYVTTLPVRIMLDTFSGVFSFITSFILGDHRNAISNPADDVISTLQEFEENYGSVHPVFYQGSYSQALADAKKELMFLMVYLHCPDHQSTDKFCRRTLTSPEVVQYINGNFLFWSCSVKKPEGYRTSEALRENSYPFVGIIVLRNNRMCVVGRIEDDLEPNQFLTKVRRIVADNEAYLIVAREERNERQLNQTIRREQDEAYLESLRADQEKEERKRKEIEEKERLEQELIRKEEEEKQRLEDLKKRRASTKGMLPDEPDISDPECVRVAIRLPNGQSIVRRFLRSHSLKYLYYFVFSNEDAPSEFQLATSYPRRVLPCKPEVGSADPPTIADSGLGRSEALFVYDLES